MATKAKVYFVLEYASGGELLRRIVSQVFPFVPASIRKQNREVGCAKYLFLVSVLHRSVVESYQKKKLGDSSSSFLML
jgi:hypothetical protein